MREIGFPPKQGLYDPWYEHDSCGVGFVADLNGKKSHEIVSNALKILLNLEHRGACGCESNTGDGAGILIQTPHLFFQEECDRLGIKLPKYGDYAVGDGLSSLNCGRSRSMRAASGTDRTGRGPAGSRLADSTDR